MRHVCLLRTLLTLTALVAVSFSMNGQMLSNPTYLKEFAKEKEASFLLGKAHAAEFARQYNIPTLIRDENGYSELMSVSNTGVPLYYTVTNKNSASTISTGKLETDGLPGIVSDGHGMAIFQWDAGTVFADHQELSGRVNQGDQGSVSYHATHIAGTMIGKGIDPRAKGMATEAVVNSFEWNNDIAEMAEAASEGALLSNHSYGMVRGWATNGNQWFWLGDTTVSTQEDYLFGFYDSQAQDWDVIAHEAPGYLMVKSAGNDRNEGPESGTHPKDGPWDCLSGAAVAKNVLTVGAVDAIPTGYTKPSDAEMSSFSSWGPTDDGRIKPDLVADGIGVYSSGSNSETDYLTLCGTSMATASVTGSLALLQQINYDLTQSYLLAATLKGLVIATADEAGTAAGPDYQYGWGVMNTMKAATCLKNNNSCQVIFENVLENNGEYTHTFQADGQHSYRIVLSWTDVPGTPVQPAVDPEDRMLVNDLDLLVSSNTATWYPWKLDPHNPSAPATCSGSNDADNLEVVMMPTPGAGTCTIHISHKGSLIGDLQPYSLIIYELSLQDPAAGLYYPQGTSEESLRTSGVRISPNPAEDLIRIETPLEGPCKITFFDNLGRKIRDISSSDQELIDIRDLPSGTYILLVESGDQKRTGKLIKK